MNYRDVYNQVISDSDWQLKPEILSHPNIPKPLHGLNPRTIKGQEWWDVTRREAYARTNFHCVACGVHKNDAKKHRWLEAHEYFDIDYKTGRCEVISIEPLCHYCHNFIHSGRLQMIMGKDKSQQEVIDILEHGFGVLAEHDLKAFPGTIDFAEDVNANTFGVRPYRLWGNEALPWNSWRLVLDGEEYKPLHDSYDGWYRHYNR